MRSQRLFFVALALLAVQVVPNLLPTRAAPQAYNIAWYRAGDVSGGALDGTSYRLHGSAGQNVAGVVNSTSYALCSGVQCLPRAKTARGVYLPVVSR